MQPLKINYFECKIKVTNSEPGRKLFSVHARDDGGNIDALVCLHLEPACPRPECIRVSVSTSIVVGCIYKEKAPHPKKKFLQKFCQLFIIILSVLHNIKTLPQSPHANGLIFKIASKPATKITLIREDTDKLLILLLYNAEANDTGLDFRSDKSTILLYTSCPKVYNIGETKPGLV